MTAQPSALEREHAKLIVKLAGSPPLPIFGGLADEHDTRRRIAHMATIVSATVTYVAACCADLNENLPVTIKVDGTDFDAAVTDQFADLTGAFECSAREIVRERYDGARPGRHVRRIPISV